MLGLLSEYAQYLEQKESILTLKENGLFIFILCVFATLFILSFLSLWWYTDNNIKFVQGVTVVQRRLNYTSRGALACALTSLLLALLLVSMLILTKKDAEVAQNNIERSLRHQLMLDYILDLSDAEYIHNVESYHYFGANERNSFVLTDLLIGGKREKDVIVYVISSERHPYKALIPYEYKDDLPRVVQEYDIEWKVPEYAPSLEDWVDVKRMSLMTYGRFDWSDVRYIYNIPIE